MFSIITGRNLLAQGTAKTDTSGYKFWKNELGTNIAPIISSLMGGYIPNQQYTISYKRIIKGANAIRINAAIQIYVRNNFQTNNPNLPDNYELVSQSANSEVRRYSEDKRDPKFQLGMGYEWRKGSHRLSRFYGLDLVLGRTSSSYTKKDYFMVLDSTASPSSLASGGAAWIIDPNNNQPSTAFDSRTNSLYFGLSPFYGLRYPITKRLIVTAQIGFDATMAIGNYTSDDYTNNIHLSGMVTTVDFDSRGVISDVTLAYRF